MLDSTAFVTADQGLVDQPSAVSYTRVSSKDQERGGFSIPAQRKLLLRYAAEQGLHIAAEFSDVETAGKTGRTGFDAMLRHLRNHATCPAILVEKTDRLYRNLKDWVTLDELGVTVHLVKEGVVLSDESVSSEKFVHGIKVLMAKNYLDNLSEEVCKGLNEKVQQGHWPGKAPIGYCNIGGRDGKRIIAPDPVLGPIVTQLFGWYATGTRSLTEVTEMAGKAGLVTKQSRRPVPRSQVHATLRNPFYMGLFIWKGVRYPAAHDPLVSREVWDDVQAVLSGRAPQRRKVRQRRHFAFGGLIHCGVCADEGKRFLLVPEIKKERYVYYRCEECKRQRRATYVREEKLVEAYAIALAALEPNDQLLDMLAAALGGDTRGAAEEDPSAPKVLQAELTALEIRLDMAYSDRLEGRIDALYFDGRAREWRRRMDVLRQELEGLEVTAALPRTDDGRALELRQLVEIFENSDNPPLQRRVVEILHSNSSWKEGNLEIGWRNN